jgi:hypothetical protein
MTFEPVERTVRAGYPCTEVFCMMQQVQDNLVPQGISQKGQKILDVLAQTLAAQHFGRFIAIEVDSGEYFLGGSVIEATRKAQATYPGKIFFLGRIGYRTAYTFKGRR